MKRLGDAAVPGQHFLKAAGKNETKSDYSHFAQIDLSNP